MSRPVAWSKTLTFFEDDWHEGNVPIMGPRTHAAWLCTSVFDGARAFEGTTPDLERHCARVNESAKSLCLKPLVAVPTWRGLVREGLKRFDRNAELYIRPMYWAEEGAPGGVRPDPELDAMVFVHLRSAVSQRRQHGHHAFAVPPPDKRNRSGGREGRLPLSEQRARADRGARPRLR